MLIGVMACTLLVPAPTPEPAPEPETQPPPVAKAKPKPESKPRATQATPARALLLLDLATQVIGSSSPDARREIVRLEQQRFDADPSQDNLLRLTIVKAYSAALPAELKAVQDDLEALAKGDEKLSDDQRQVALMTLVMVDERLRMGDQILGLQQQIDELTEIEASLNHNGPPAPLEESP